MKEIGILYMPDGSERKVYPLHSPEPEAPPEQVIVFPDKKTYEVNWRRNFERIIEASRAVEAAEFVQEEGTYRVPITDPRVRYAVGLNFSDAHIGSYTTDHELLLSLIDTLQKIPNSFLVDTGDTFDNGIWGGLQFEQILPPYMQAFTVEDMMRELGDRYAACVIGNHSEWLFTAAGQKPEMIFARAMKGPIFPGMGLLHLEAGNQKYDWAMAHNYWGKSKKNIFNVCVNLRNTEYPDADVFSVGHEHVWGYGEEMVDGRKVLYLRPGTGKIRDRYARMHGVAKRGQACGLAVIFGLDKKEFNAYPLSDAVDLMNLRVKIAELTN